MAHKLQDQLPWTQRPLIVNAPMAGYAGGALAAAVSNSGGLGQIGAIVDMSALDKELQLAQSRLNNPSAGRGGTLAVGVGLLVGFLKPEQVLPVLIKYRPAVVWMFAAKDLSDYATWAAQLRSALPDTKVWIQVGSVTAALAVAKDAGPDALVLQGSDAGGHGFERGASIVSVLPEATDLLKSSGLGHIPLLASGGIADARGAAAAVVLGADGVVLGTRFLAAGETIIPDGYRDLVLSTSDGATNTARSKVFDNVAGPSIWPDAYDGRCLVTESYRDYRAGVAIEEVRDRHNKAVQGEDLGFGKTNRANVWAGTGIGLVRQVDDASIIVNEIRNGITNELEKANAKL
ncbi:hypothetical protein B0A52_06624 [Exophiala mesophila]|uniref:Uncharacterized protein n=1 Tax=Exophiala mesophila TaxID=212818 RepID=A0A438N1F4_EXOME|nr:hypothetical protein B0A52_06624 [Exophiala mesophila]